MKITYKNNQKPQKMATVEKSFPLVFFLLSMLGLNIASIDKNGQYYVAKWRFVPLICISGIIVWSFIHNIVNVSNGTTEFINIVVYLNYIASAGHLVTAAFISFWKKFDYCDFLTALPSLASQTKYRKYLLDFLLVVYMAVSFYFYPWKSTQNDPLNVVLGVITVLVMPILPALLDLQACCLVQVVVEAHQDLVRKIQEKPGKSNATDTKKMMDGKKIGTFIQVLPFLSADEKQNALDSGIGPSSWVEEGTGAIRVVKVRDHTNYLHSLVTGYNQVFSNVTTLRCALFLLKMMALPFAVMVGYPGNSVKFYLVDELLRFYLVCSFADSLAQLHEEVEDGVLALQESNHTYEEDRLLYHALASRMSARPAFVSIGGMVSLGRGMMAAFINIALTYAIIVYQYRPGSNEGCI